MPLIHRWRDQPSSVCRAVPTTTSAPAPLVAGMGYRGWAATPTGVPDGEILGERDLLAVHTAAPRNPPVRRPLAA